MVDSVFTSMLNKTGQLIRMSTGSPNSLGERRTTETNIETVTLRLQPLRERYSVSVGGREHEITAVAYFLIGTSVAEGDLLEVDEVKYLVAGIEDEAGENHHNKVLLVRR